MESELAITDADSKWLGAHYDPVANIYTFTSCIALADLNADGEYKMVVADLGSGNYDMKIKVFKGTTQIMENVILDLPTGVCAFHMDQALPLVPAIAAASGPYVYVYKNLRPYFKFTLPPLAVNSVEQDLWNQAREEKIDVAILREMLSSLRSEDSAEKLSIRSLKFLNLDESELESYAQLHKYSPLKRQTVITCMVSIKKYSTDETAISCIVVGTENKDVFIMDPEAFTILTQHTLPSVPVFLTANGLYDVEYRLIIACRNGKIYTMKRGTQTPKQIIELSSQAVGMERVGKNIMVGCMDQTLICYTSKGKRLWCVNLPASVLTMEVMDHKQKSFKGVFVALSNCEVHLYKEKFLVNILKTEDVVTALKFGSFGREDGALIMTTKGGGLIIKLLRRSATFEDKDLAPGPPAAQNTKINLPKKTKLFVDQTLRERENATVMHRMFQRDLYKLRLNIAKAYLKALEGSMAPITSNPAEPLTFSAHVQGIGPTYKLSVKLQNTSTSTPSLDLRITFTFDDALYNIDKKLIHVPILIPGLDYIFDTLVHSLSDKGIADNISVLVYHPGYSTPLITGVINMPISEGVSLG